MLDELLGRRGHDDFKAGSVGLSLRRVDGVGKVTGTARFTAEHCPDGLTHGVVVGSAIARGRVAEVDSAAAERSPGFVAIFTSGTAPRLVPLLDKVQGIQYSGEGGLIEMLFPMQDDRIHYAGQAIALVVAETYEQALHAATLLEVRYEEEAAELTLESATRRSKPDSYCGMEPLQLSNGDPAGAYDGAEVRLERRYDTPIHTHSAIEMLSTVARWELRDGEEHLVVADTTRVIKTLSAVLAHSLAVPEAHIHLTVKYLGDSYGSKAWMFGNVLLIASCARALGRPLKVEWSRAQMFEVNGYRPETRQTMRIGADREGRIASLRHDATSPTSTVSGYPEPVTGMTMMMYRAPNIAVAQEIRHLNLPTPSPMRGVGVLAGGWALETAMDELAYETGLDPIVLRERNDADRGPLSGLEFSSKHLSECFARGREMIGWERRHAKPGGDDRGRWITGLGVAASTLPAVLDQASARAELRADGTALVTSATHEIGNGAYTIFRQIAADALRMPDDRVTFDLGDNSLPHSPITAGSRTTASVGAAILVAGRKVINELTKLARGLPDGPFRHASAADVRAVGGALQLTDRPGVRMTYSEVLRAAGRDALVADGSFTPPSKSKFPISALTKSYEMHSFGAIFAEVRVDRETGVVRVPRLVGVFDVGRVINPLTTTSQLRGAMIAGLGAALFEEGWFDPNNGRAVVRNLADYHTPSCADVPAIAVETLGIPDRHMGDLGARGLGEIGTNNVPAAIGNAIFNATGRRLRSLPLTPDRMLAALHPPFDDAAGEAISR